MVYSRRGANCSIIKVKAVNDVFRSRKTEQMYLNINEKVHARARNRFAACYFNRTLDEIFNYK